MINNFQTQIVEKDSIIAEGSKGINGMKRSLVLDAKKMSRNKFFIGAKHIIWDKIIMVMNNLKIHFDVLQ
jgi:hypothetical protein